MPTPTTPESAHGWIAPAEFRSTLDVNTVFAGLRDPASRDAALAFLDAVTDSAMLYVLASRFGAPLTDQSAKASADDQRAFIRSRI